MEEQGTCETMGSESGKHIGTAADRPQTNRSWAGGHELTNGTEQETLLSHPVSSSFVQNTRACAN